MNRSEVTALFNKAERLRDWPGSYFPALQEARNAKKQWETEHPAEAQAERDEKAAFKASEAARREKEFKNSFIGKGID